MSGATARLIGELLRVLGQVGRDVPRALAEGHRRVARDLEHEAQEYEQAERDLTPTLPGQDHGSGAGDGPDGHGPPGGRPAARRALEDATRAGKLDHVFVPKHKLGPLVARYGSREAAMREMVAALVATVHGEGRFVQVIEVGGQTVTVRGAVVDGVIRIGTAFTP